MTHTADEATLDGKIKSQYLANASSANFKNLKKSNLLRDYYQKVFNQHPPHLLQERILLLGNGFGYASVLSQEIKS